ncbi:GroES-like protein [Calocera cornea HHB12733]|uniref:GroES-like protein n=1 Tax=Calocera cornea HHB12733 TaxID=1353952 RepID=A0A165GPY4_9BASI|nr:GroES-like protein [Calocera cornea HHB12733]
MGELPMNGYHDTEFKGIGVSEESKAWSDLQMLSFAPKTWTEDDVEIAITHCGICGSDIHSAFLSPYYLVPAQPCCIALSGGWGPVRPPLIVGHEIVGIATKVGSNVEGITVGDRVGVGAGIQSCHQCELCKRGDENYCGELLWTYNGRYPDGVKTMGGYATAIRANQQFVFPIPESLGSAEASSMLCAGLTVFQPLQRYNIGPGSKVGVIGIGGLGHYAVLFGKALGAEVTAFSHSPNKETDVKKMGADKFIVSSAGFEKSLRRYYDLIICTIDVTAGFPLAEYLSTLYPLGTLIMVGLPDDAMPAIRAGNLTASGVKLGGSSIGSKREALKMLDLAVKHDIKPWIEVMPMSKAPEAVELMRAGKARYRIILEQDLQDASVPSHL